MEQVTSSIFPEEWTVHMFSYKKLKKACKAVAEGEHKSTEREREFVSLVCSEISKVHEFFLSKEEELVMAEFSTRARAQAAASSYDSASITAAASAVAQLHGELVMLENFFQLNFLSVVKGLKKHDKNVRDESARLRSPFLRSLMQQPWYSTEQLKQLISRCEEQFKNLRDATHRLSYSSHSGANVKLDRPLQALQGTDACSDTEEQVDRAQKAIEIWHSLEGAEALRDPLGEEQQQQQQRRHGAPNEDAPAFDEQLPRTISPQQNVELDGMEANEGLKFDESTRVDHTR